MGNCLITQKGGNDRQIHAYQCNSVLDIVTKDTEKMYVVCHFYETIKVNGTSKSYTNISTTEAAGIRLRYYNLDLNKNDTVSISVGSEYGAFVYSGDSDNIHLQTIVGTTKEITVANDRTAYIIASAKDSVYVNGVQQSATSIGTTYSYLSLRRYTLNLKKGDVLKVTVSSGFGVALLYDGSETL